MNHPFADMTIWDILIASFNLAFFFAVWFVLVRFLSIKKSQAEKAFLKHFDKGGQDVD